MLPGYKEFLEAAIVDTAEKDPKLVKKQFIQSYENHSTESTVRFVIKMTPQRLQKLVDSGGMDAGLRLTSSLSTSNMHLFNEFGVIMKYASTGAVLRAFYTVRLQFYERRKAFLLKKLQRELDIMENKVRFIEEVMSGALVVFRRPKGDVVADLRASGYMVVDAAADLLAEMPDAAGDYSYLISMQIGTFTTERIMALVQQREQRAGELAACRAKLEKDMWRDDLAAFSAKYAVLVREYALKAASEKAAQKGGVGKKRKASHR